MTDFLRFIFPGLPVSKEKQIAQEILAALKGGEGSGNFGHAGRPGEVGGSASNSISTNQLIMEIPNEFRNIPAPEIRVSSDTDQAHFQFGRINIPPEGTNRTKATFDHEYGHYYDYKTGASSSTEFNKAFESDAELAKLIKEPDYPASDNFYKNYGYEETGAMVRALTNGGSGWYGHNKDYFQIAGHDKKEAFAIAFGAYVHYNPTFFREFPAMKSYFDGLSK